MLTSRVSLRRLRPQHEVQKLRIVSHYRLHPLPFGFQWQARPLHPDRGDATGAAWLVGAASEPPCQAQPLGTTFVLISKVRDVGSRKAAVGAICASQRTKRHMQREEPHDAAGPADPWMNGADLWAQARDSGPRSELKLTGEAITKLAQIEASLKQEVQGMVQQQLQVNQPPPGLSEHDQRLQALEVGMREVRAQGAKFEEWFQSCGTRINDQAAALTTLQHTVKDQQAELVKCRTDISQAVTGLQAEMSQQLSSQLQGQFEQIQALVQGGEKKQRSS